MAEICPVCGLPKDLCVCEEMSKEQQRIRVRLETRKWGKKWTVIDGIDSKDVSLNKIASELKAKCACGGTAKNDDSGRFKKHEAQYAATIVLPKVQQPQNKVEGELRHTPADLSL